MPVSAVAKRSDTIPRQIKHRSRPRSECGARILATNESRVGMDARVLGLVLIAQVTREAVGAEVEVCRAPQEVRAPILAPVGVEALDGIHEFVLELAVEVRIAVAVAPGVVRAAAAGIDSITEGVVRAVEAEAAVFPREEVEVLEVVPVATAEKGTARHGDEDGLAVGSAADIAAGAAREVLAEDVDIVLGVAAHIPAATRVSGMGVRGVARATPTTPDLAGTVTDTLMRWIMVVHVVPNDAAMTMSSSSLRTNGTRKLSSFGV